MDNRNKDKDIDEKIEEALNDPIEDNPPTPDNIPDDTPSGVEEIQSIKDDKDDSTPDDDNSDDDDVDYEEKFKSSSKEAMVLFFKNKHLNDKIEEAATLPDPTQEDLKQYALMKGAEWDNLDTFSQNILRDSYINDRRFSLIHEASKAGREFEAWEKKVVDFTESPETVAKYPVISDYSGKFRRFCMKEGRMGMNLEDLLASFLFHQEKDGRTKVAKNKKTMFLSGGAGGNEPIKPPRLTAEQVQSIRVTDPKRYKQLIKEGKIDLGLLESE